MPMTPELRRGIDRLRDYLFGGGYPNPAQNAEQHSFLIYFYMYEAVDAARVRAANRPGAEPYVSAFDGRWRLRDPRNAPKAGQRTVQRRSLRWSSWAPALNGDRLVNWVREEVFPFHAQLAADRTSDFRDGARLVIDEPTALTQVVSQLNGLHLDRVDADTKGDLFEHVLRQVRKAATPTLLADARLRQASAYGATGAIAVNGRAAASSRHAHWRGEDRDATSTSGPANAGASEGDVN